VSKVLHLLKTYTASKTKYLENLKMHQIYISDCNFIRNFLIFLPTLNSQLVPIIISHRSILFEGYQQIFTVTLRMWCASIFIYDLLYVVLLHDNHVGSNFFESMQVTIYMGDEKVFREVYWLCIYFCEVCTNTVGSTNLHWSIKYLRYIVCITRLP